MRRALFVLLLTGCNGGLRPEAVCAIEAHFSGALGWSLLSQGECDTQPAGPDIDATWFVTDAPVAAIELRIADVAMGETAAGLAATLRVHRAIGSAWSSDACSVDITRHADVGGGEYRAAGSATCPLLVFDNDDEPPLVVEELDFVITSMWP